MRIGIISDVHCNLKGLEKAIEGMGPVDHILCAGDLVYHNTNSDEVIDLARSLGIKCVLGNQEASILSRTNRHIRPPGVTKPENMEFLTNLPICLEVQLDGKKIYMVHGSPWQPLREYLMPEDRKIELLKNIDADFVVLGHTHFPMVKRVGNVTVINPGSCGEPRDHNYGLQLTYAVLDTVTGEAEIRVVDESEIVPDYLEHVSPKS